MQGAWYMVSSAMYLQFDAMFILGFRVNTIDQLHSTMLQRNAQAQPLAVYVLMRLSFTSSTASYTSACALVKPPSPTCNVQVFRLFVTNIREDEGKRYMI